MAKRPAKPRRSPSTSDGSEAESRPLPASFFIGDGVDVDSQWTAITLTVELPFWVLVPEADVQVTVEGFTFTVGIFSSFVELHAARAADSKASCAYEGPVAGAQKACGEMALRGIAAVFRKPK
jgi:hypothetical protein